MHDDHKDSMHKKVKKRYGSSINHGKAHSEQHEFWSRRNFLRTTGLTSLGAFMALQGNAITSMMPNVLTKALTNSEGERILVLIRFAGGNDGLNTIIHRGNDEYYNIRPSIAIPESGLWALSDDYGMPNLTLPLQPFWEQDRMKVIHNVGYPNPNYSHFRSSDIWASASDRYEYLDSGWIGRAMDVEFPSFQETPPIVPPAIQIGIESNLIFRGADANLALSISNPTQFYQIAQNGQLYDTEGLENCPSESELKFVRNTANSAFRYSQTIQEAYKKGITKAAYDNNSLAEQLSIVARLIKGDLGTKVYMVSIGGFDTHSNQLERHDRLMDRLAGAVSSFYEDLDVDGWGQNVLGMTFSEFGRTIFENGSAGTDHGTGAPMILFGGNDLGSGFVGDAPDLVNVGEYGDPDFSVDFRSVYASVLKDWLCIDKRVVDHVLGEQGYINNLVPAGTPNIGFNGQDALLGFQPDINGSGVIVKYALIRGGITKLSLLHLDGRYYRTLFNEFRDRGSYKYSINSSQEIIAPGTYMIQLETGGKIFNRILSL